MRHLFALLIILTVTSGCTLSPGKSLEWTDQSVSLYWPPPPNKPHIRYLREFKAIDSFNKKSTSKKIFNWLTGDREEILPLVSPYGIAVDGRGRIWVADKGIRGVHQIDLAKEEVNYIQSAGNTPLATPSGVAVDLDRQRLYVSDATLAKVYLYDLNGHFINEWDAPDHFGRPGGLAVDKSGNLYVVDAKKNRLSIFSHNGELLRNLTSKIQPDFTFNTPSNVAINDDGQIFIVDSMNFRVEAFSQDGESLGTIGSIGDGPGYFARPRGIAIDSIDHIYVADAVFDNVQVFDSSGNLLIYFGQPGKKAGEFSLPAGMAMDQENRLYVVDSFNHRLQIFQYLP